MPTLTSQPQFLSSKNPAQLKRNVLASFTSVLLIPVTIVPRAVGTVGGAIVTGGKSLGMLNPAKWGGVAESSIPGPEERVSKTGWGVGAARNANEVQKNEDTVFEVGEEDYEEEKVERPLGDEWTTAEEKDAWGDNDGGPPTLLYALSLLTPHLCSPASSVRSSKPSLLLPNPQTSDTAADSISITSATLTVPTPNSSGVDTHLNKLDLLLSLDVALEMIHADRESLKRMETFAGYPGHYGHRVRDSVEELFILLLNSIGEGHLKKGFGK